MTENNSHTSCSSSFPPSDWIETTLGEVIFPISETFNFKGKNKVHFLNTGDILEGKLLHQNLSDVSEIGHWGNGDYEFSLNSSSDFINLMPLIKQSYERNK